jgi:hypothetical protein
MEQKVEEVKEKTVVEVEPLPNLYKLSQWLSVRETLEVAGLEHAASMTGKQRYANRYELRTLKIGGTRAYFAKDVRGMAIDINIGQAIGTDARKKAKKITSERYKAVMVHVMATRNVAWADYVDIDEAMKIVAPDITTKEAIYRLTDYRANGKSLIKTVQIGRTHLYNKRDVENVKYQRSVRVNRTRITRLRSGMANPAS